MRLRRFGSRAQVRAVARRLLEQEFAEMDLDDDAAEFFEHQPSWRKQYEDRARDLLRAAADPKGDSE